jgi:ABC-2 type transport system ATP-binding protein
MSELAIRSEGLTKRYGEVAAADRVDLAIPASSFFGLLGPNGAGKTTTIHMLSTLIRPSAGEAWVAGQSVRTAPLAVRAAIGVVFQEQALDRTLTVTENLRFAGRLQGLSGAEIRSRSDELLELFGLSARRHHTVGALSGGQRRALDIARGVIHRPRILFLDEPTIGLDLPSRRAIWRYIAQLRTNLGITVFLTTHYLEEAIECDEVAFIANGRIVQKGAPWFLIRQLGEWILEIETDQPAEVERKLTPRLGPGLIETDRVHFRCEDEPGELVSLKTELDHLARAVRWRRPNLNDVFLWVNRTETVRKAA